MRDRWGRCSHLPAKEKYICMNCRELVMEETYMKPTVFVDVDGVIANSMPWWLTLYNYKHCTNITVDMITDWDLHKCVGIDLSEYFDDYRGVQAIKDARTSLLHIEAYYDIILTTAGSGEYWTRMNGYSYPVLHTPLKMKKYLRGFALIDDYDKNLDGFDGHQYLFGQPWNANCGRRQMTWKEIAEDLLDYARGDIADGVFGTPI